MKIKITLLAVLAVLLGSLGMRGQQVAIKTNLLYDAFAAPSLGVEVAVAPKWTFDLSANTNYWSINKHEWKHWEVTPEMRYWFCEKFQGNFIGVNVMGGMYNFANIGGLKKFLNNDLTGLKDNRYKGWGVGAGIVYGHTWVLGKHWNLEAEIGVGWIYTRYDQKTLKDNPETGVPAGTKVRDNAVHNYVGPTKAAINLEYVF